MKRFTLLAIAGLLLLVACTDEPDSSTTTEFPPTSTTEASTSTTEGATETTTAGETTTTVQPSDGSAAYIAVRLDNGPGVAQFNLDRADVILETMVEGGLTRFTAMYRSDLPSLAGPVRSLRPVDADLLSPFNPVVVTSGAQPWVRNSIEAAGVAVLGPETGVLTDTGNLAPNHLATSPAGLAPSTGFGPLPTPFGDTPPETEGEAVDRVEVILSPARTVAFQRSDGAWAHEQDGKPTLSYDEDFDTHEILTDNVIILLANERGAGYADTSGSPVFDYDVIGAGDFTLLTADGLYTGTWSRASLDEPWVLVDSDGETVSPPEGRLFVLVAPDQAELTSS